MREIVAGGPDLSMLTPPAGTGPGAPVEAQDASARLTARLVALAPHFDALARTQWIAWLESLPEPEWRAYLATAPDALAGILRAHGARAALFGSPEES